MKVLITTGGTGGHVYPAIALAQQIMTISPESEVLFIGGDLATNRYFDRKTFNHHTIPCGSFVKKSPLSFGKSILNIGRGIQKSRKIIKEFKPDVVVGFGSFYTFPPLVAAKMLGVPLILHEANSIPGKVNRLLAPLADAVGVHFPETIHLLRGHVVEVGMPLRMGFCQTDISQQEARSYFGLNQECTTLLVFGGSQGANAINQLLFDAIGCFSQLPSPIQVLHLTGDNQLQQQFEKTYQQHGIKACVKCFETNMQMAWRAADLIVARSGAGTIAEQLEFEIPAIFIPYPKAAENHQEHNANFMVSRVGGAIKLNEKGLKGKRLVECLNEFLKNDQQMIFAMKQSMQHYKKKARTRDLCSLLLEIVR